MPNCDDCGKEILFLAHIETGKPNPIEAVPSKNGNLVIDRENGKYRFATRNEKDIAKIYGKKLYISHFANCVSAEKFRKASTTK